MVASIIRTIFAQPDAEHVATQFDEVTRMLVRSHPKLAAMLSDARGDLLAFTGFPQRHWRQIWSTNPLERANNEIKRRTDVVGVFPNPAALLRLAGAVLIEQHDEWEASDRRYFSEASMLELTAINSPTETIEGVNLIPELSAAQAETTAPHRDRKLDHPVGRGPQTKWRPLTNFMVTPSDRVFLLFRGQELNLRPLGCEPDKRNLRSHFARIFRAVRGRGF